MERPLQITLHDVPKSEALEAHIREKAAALEKFYPRITGCHVTVEVPHRHKHQGNAFDVRIDLRLPGQEIVINRELNPDPYVALRDVFDAARRKLEDYAQRQRGEVKLHAEVLHGRVSRLNYDEGYGFIEIDGGEAFYFNRDNVVGTAFEALQSGTAVHFIVDMSGDRPQAKRVGTGKHHGA